MRIFITGATGTVGCSVVKQLAFEKQHDLFVLVRKPCSPELFGAFFEKIFFIQGDLENIRQHGELLSSMDMVILAATAWGPTSSMVVNVQGQLELLSFLRADKCKGIITFSTASILDRQGQLLQQAGSIGTPYIRSKYEFAKKLKALQLGIPVHSLYPTVVLGGERGGAKSHVSTGLERLLPWLPLFRFLRVSGCFHCIHAKDIARIVCHLVALSLPDNSEFILGYPAMEVNQVVAALVQSQGLRRVPGITIPLGLLRFLAGVLPVHVAPWDLYCLEQQEIVYDETVGSADFGLESEFDSLEGLIGNLHLSYSR